MEGREGVREESDGGAGEGGRKALSRICVPMCAHVCPMYMHIGDAADFTMLRLKFHRLNLATYVTTHMEAEVEELIRTSVNINLADAVQYPSCVAMNDRREPCPPCCARMPPSILCVYY